MFKPQAHYKIHHYEILLKEIKSRNFHCIKDREKKKESWMKSQKVSWIESQKGTWTRIGKWIVNRIIEWIVNENRNIVNENRKIVNRIIKRTVDENQKKNREQNAKRIVNRIFVKKWITISRFFVKIRFIKIALCYLHYFVFVKFAVCASYIPHSTYVAINFLAEYLQCIRGTRIENYCNAVFTFLWLITAVELVLTYSK